MSGISQPTQQEPAGSAPLGALNRPVPISTTVSTTRRWAMLAAGTSAQAASAVMTNGPAFLIPALVGREGLSLAQAGLVAAAPIAGEYSSACLIPTSLQAVA